MSRRKYRDYDDLVVLAVAVICLLTDQPGWALFFFVLWL